MTIKNKIIAATPFISLIIFLLMGYIWGLWHPGWIIFLTIPIFSIFTHKSKRIHIDDDDEIHIKM